MSKIEFIFTGGWWNLGFSIGWQLQPAAQFVQFVKVFMTSIRDQKHRRTQIFFCLLISIES